MASPELKLEVSIVPSEKTVQACLKLLDLWQEANPGLRVGLMDRDGKLVHEIIERSRNEVIRRDQR